MLYQAIPFFTILVLAFINLLKKRQLICVSNLVLLYYVFCYGGAIFVYLKPRTGFPFSDFNAMKYLAICIMFLLLPLLFLKDNAKLLPDAETLTLNTPKMWMFKKIIAIITVFAFVFFLPNIGKLVNFLLSDVSREVYRLDLDRSIRGNYLKMAAGFCMCFSKLALFLAVHSFVFDKDRSHRKVFYCLLLGSLSLSLWAMDQIDRRELGKIIFLLVVLFVIYYHYLGKEKKKQFVRFACLCILLILIPFGAISIYRFSGDVMFQLFQYFSLGPYFFNADYIASTEMGLPLFYGNYNFPILTKCLEVFIKIPQQPYLVQELWSSPDILQEFFSIYYSISMCHPFEFKTLIGCFLLDYPADVVLWICVGIGCVFLFYFRFSKVNIAYLFVTYIYSYTLLFGTIMWAFSFFIFNLELLLLIFSFFLLWLYDKSQFPKTLNH